MYTCKYFLNICMCVCVYKINIHSAHTHIMCTQTFILDAIIAVNH